jgi:tRNA U34 5-methylaminomethyl-2-thiouridine-forming methyltransferase MnmC
MQTQIKITGDGSATLYVPKIDEIYHSIHGAVQESLHIFINNGLKLCNKENINILETGFGTGLNAFLTLIEAEQSNKQIVYTALEKYPVNMETVEKLNYPALCNAGYRDYFAKLHLCEWNKTLKISSHFSIRKILCDFTRYTGLQEYDIVFFDAFSPEKQPEMWSEKMFAKLYRHCRRGAILTTYCAKGSVRRAMMAAGFRAERLPGPPGKRQMLIGYKDCFSG